MPLDHWVSIFSAVISFFGLLFVAVQIRDATRQRESDPLVKIYGINRELLSLGFAHPQLFALLNDSEHADPVWERRSPSKVWPHPIRSAMTQFKPSR